MSTETRDCPQCGREMTASGGYMKPVMGDEYYFTYYECEPCAAWYEESIRDVFCGPSVVTLYTIPESEVVRRLAEEP